MFGRRWAYQYEGADEDRGGWRRGGRHERRSWWRHGGRGRPFFGWQMRRRFFGPGGPFGPGGAFGHGGPLGEEEPDGFPGWGKRFFGRGDLKYALLELLVERPMHGYEMMKALQERTGGMYTPSAGSVYPTLQMLEDRGFVTVSDTEGKKVYTITDTGRAFLAEGQSEEEGDPRRAALRQALRGGFRHAHEEEWAEMGALVQELREFGMLFVSVWRNAMHDPEKRARLRKLIEQTRAELAAIAGQPRESAD
jgi:DNA-binding PadR family transcriptional regulator